MSEKVYPVYGVFFNTSTVLINIYYILQYYFLLFLICIIIRKQKFINNDKHTHKLLTINNESYLKCIEPVYYSDHSILKARQEMEIRWAIILLCSLWHKIVIY